MGARARFVWRWQDQVYSARYDEAYALADSTRDSQIKETPLDIQQGLALSCVCWPAPNSDKPHEIKRSVQSLPYAPNDEVHLTLHNISPKSGR